MVQWGSEEEEEEEEEWEWSLTFPWDIVCIDPTIPDQS